MGRIAVVVWLGALLAAALIPLSTQAKSRPIGFSNLVFRLDEDRIGVAAENYRVYILEELRAAGLAAVGAESLVFGKDEAAKAELLKLTSGSSPASACKPGCETPADCRAIHPGLTCWMGLSGKKACDFSTDTWSTTE